MVCECESSCWGYEVRGVWDGFDEVSAFESFCCVVCGSSGEVGECCDVQSVEEWHGCDELEDMVVSLGGLHGFSCGASFVVSLGFLVVLRLDRCLLCGVFRSGCASATFSMGCCMGALVGLASSWMICSARVVCWFILWVMMWCMRVDFPMRVRRIGGVV